MTLNHKERTYNPLEGGVTVKHDWEIPLLDLAQKILNHNIHLSNIFGDVKNSTNRIRIVTNIDESVRAKSMKTFFHDLNVPRMKREIFHSSDRFVAFDIPFNYEDKLFETS
ncbi:hypothetical protein RF11_05383 [Thelohanellus kitauei]|uniref:Uncharacterized protein n=1 Tax=Thelohanellus kitauei TaxID=669202 RepID=A0A0C2MUY5_THEKT|nr:hypothetical protein RF11_05383 [Thelohanellus kitauei]